MLIRTNSAMKILLILSELNLAVKRLPAIKIEVKTEKTFDVTKCQCALSLIIDFLELSQSTNDNSLSDEPNSISMTNSVASKNSK